MVAVALDPRAAYAEACAAQAQAERSRAIVDADAAGTRVEELSRELLTAARQLQTARRRARALERDLSDERDRLEADHDKLATLPQVARVAIVDGVVRVLTRPVVLEHRARTYLMGEFALELDLARGVRITNRCNTITRGGWEHPHIQGEIPCLGNLSDGVVKLLAACELVPLTAMLLRFLESYDPTTAYCPVESWREVTP